MPNFLQLRVRGPDILPTTRCSLSRSLCCARAFDSCQLQASQDVLSGRAVMREKLWRDFFSDPSQWWDHRAEKLNPRYPDFKHKKTKHSLWIIDNLSPAWVQRELAAIAPGLLQSHVFSWHVRLRRHLEAGDYRTTLNLFEQMQQAGMILDKFAFVPVLKACSNLRSLEEGRRVHEQIIRGGCESDVYVANCLVDMYTKCGSIADAWSVFNNMGERDVVSWNTMIGSYVKSEQGLKALELFHEMQQEEVEPDAVTFVGVLNACSRVTALEEGKRVHAQVIQRGCESDAYVATCLVNMYAKCGCIEDAWGVFSEMSEHNVISWSAMIGGYVESGQGLKAMELFREMQQKGVDPNAVTFVGVLKACSSIGALDQGRCVHKHIIQRGCQCDVHVATCLVVMYAKCGSAEDAWRVFKNIPERNVVSWSAMIGGYAKSDQGLKALELFREMQQEGVEPDAVTFVGVLSACASVGALEEGRHVHQQIVQRGLASDVYVATCLVQMYGKCGSIEDAWNVFNRMPERNVVSWSAMIGGYVKSMQGLKALELFREMQQEEVEPDALTFVGVLNVCASLKALEEGRSVHAHILQGGWDSDIYVATSLVDMYAKCGSVEDAWSVFNKMPERNVVSWSTMIGGYVKSEQGSKALELFHAMQQERVEPNAVTFVEVLNACSIVAALEEGKRVHEQIIQSSYESDVCVATCLVDMYAKCGSIDDACCVFNKMPKHNVVSWSAMIGGYAMHGHSKKAIGLFKHMCTEGVKMDEITFTCLLSACSHGGLVKEGVRYFKSMTPCYNVVPAMEHYICMVDLLGRAGRLEEAEEVTMRMPMESNVSVWMSLLGACRIHGNIEMAKRVAGQCCLLDPENGSGHVLLSNIYATN